MKTLLACVLFLAYAKSSAAAQEKDHSAEANRPKKAAVIPAKLITRVEPKYPNEARKQRVGGTVRLRAVIRKDGTLANVTVVSGDSLLTQAATDAVQQWRYSPMLLNGAPVQIDTVVDVAFRLSVPPEPKADPKPEAKKD